MRTCAYTHTQTHTHTQHPVLDTNTTTSGRATGLHGIGGATQHSRKQLSSSFHLAPAPLALLLARHLSSSPSSSLFRFCQYNRPHTPGQPVEQRLTVTLPPQAFKVVGKLAHWPVKDPPFPPLRPREDAPAQDPAPQPVQGKLCATGRRLDPLGHSHSGPGPPASSVHWPPPSPPRCRNSIPSTPSRPAPPAEPRGGPFWHF